MRNSRAASGLAFLLPISGAIIAAAMFVGDSAPDEPNRKSNPERIRERDAKLKKEFEYLNYDLGKGIELKLIKIAAKGKSFIIGSPKDEEGRLNVVDGFDNEEQHQITFTNNYYIDVFEVTCQQFRRFVEETGYRTDAENRDEEYCWRHPGFPQTDSHPASWVSWNDAKRFCDWLNKKHPSRYVVRLPGEAEWEFACRAGSKSRYHFGDDSEKFPEYDNVADAAYDKKNHSGHGIRGSDGFADTAPVGTFKPNAFGVYDMHGNLREWCEDTLGKHSEFPKTNNSIHTKPSESRVQKGGSYGSPPTSCRSAYSYGHKANYAGSNVGFRITAFDKDD